MEITALPEPNSWFMVIAVWGVPFLAYFLGIYIRKAVFPGDGSPDLRDQLLLGIPVCLVVVSPMISALHESFGSHGPTYLFTVGIIMEHGMVVHETAAKQVKKQIEKMRDNRDV